MVFLPKATHCFEIIFNTLSSAYVPEVFNRIVGQKGSEVTDRQKHLPALVCNYYNYEDFVLELVIVLL